MGTRLWSSLALTCLGLIFVASVAFAFSRFRSAASVDGSLDKPAIERQVSGDFTCSPLHVIDGDTIRCADERVRLVGIDAPEMPGHCRQGRVCTPGDPFASKALLEALTANGGVRCLRKGLDRYGRTLGSCSNNKVNLSCELVARGAAVIRYGGFPC